MGVFNKRSGPGVAQLTQDAEKARARGNLERAQALIREAAQVLVDQGRPDEAIDLCVLERDYARAAEIAERARDWKRAAQLWFRGGDFAKAAKAQLECGEPMIAADLYERVGDYLQAAAIYERHDDLVRASRLLEKAGDKQRAADTLVRAISASTMRRVIGLELVEACRRAGVLYAELGQIEQALKVLRFGGQNLVAAKLLASSGRYDEAIDLLAQSGDFLAASEIARASGNERRAHALLAERAEKEGRFLEAAVRFEQAEMFIQAARLFEYAGELPRAAEAYEKAQQLDSAAEIYEHLGRLADAARCLKTAGREAEAAALRERGGTREDAIRAYIGAGDFVRAAEGFIMLARSGDRAMYVDAASYLTRIAPDHSEYVKARTLLAEVLVEQGDYPGALSILQQVESALTPTSEHLPVIYQYGRLLELQGYLAAARNAYRTAASLDPGFRDVSERLHRLRESDAVAAEPLKVRMVTGTPIQAPRKKVASDPGVPLAGPSLAVPQGPAAAQGVVPTAPMVAGAPRLAHGEIHPQGNTPAPARAGGPGNVPPAPGGIGAASLATPAVNDARSNPAAASMDRPLSGGGRGDAPGPSAIAAQGILTDDLLIGDPVPAARSSGNTSAPMSSRSLPLPLEPPEAAPVRDGDLASMYPSSLVGIVLRGRFRIERKVGKGAQAQVYLARDLVLDRAVAIKVLNESAAQDQTALDRFLREARFAARVHHSSCIAIFDFGQERGLTFMAMEYFEGQTLRDRLNQCPLEPPDAIHIAIQVAEALGAVHAAGIVHRDIKPTNVMIDDQLSARLTDFGVAKNLDQEMTSAGVMVGTMKYMSPEQARGRDADRRSDIFSLGVMIFEMLTGKAPFGGTLDALIRRVTAPPPELPSEVPVPDKVRKILLRCMQRKPEARYESVDPLIHDLREVLAWVPAVKVGPEVKRKSRSAKKRESRTGHAAPKRSDGAHLRVPPSRSSSTPDLSDLPSVDVSFSSQDLVPPSEQTEAPTVSSITARGVPSELAAPRPLDVDRKGGTSGKMIRAPEPILGAIEERVGGKPISGPVPGRNAEGDQDRTDELFPDEKTEEVLTRTR